MGTTYPIWVDVTWGHGEETQAKTLELCKHIQQNMGLDVLMHITCNGAKKEKINKALEKAKAHGIKNILALRGDAPGGDKAEDKEEFKYAADLVKYIKKQYQDEFCIAVAGYPEKHSQAASEDEDIKHLKEKVDAGSDIVISQFFYNQMEDGEIINCKFQRWVEKCR